MKFYTPKLLARFASADERAALAAQDALEQRAAAYAAHLTAILPDLPPRLRELQERFYLHDARLLWPLTTPAQLPTPAAASGRRGGGQFLLAVELDVPPHDVLVLHYRNARARWVAPPASGREPPVAWLHDEVAVTPSRGRMAFTHSILFTGGIELRIRLADFDFAVLKPMASKGVA